MGAGVSEKVDGDYRDYIARQDLGTIKRLYSRGGLSDQRRAYLKATIQQREAGVGTPVPITNFQEARTVEEVKFNQKVRGFELQGYSTAQAINLARQQPQPAQPTPTEEALGMSLLPEYRNLPPEQARAELQRASLPESEKRQFTSLPPKTPQTKTIESYEKAGFSPSESYFLAQKSEQAQQSFSKQRGKELIEQERAKDFYPSPSEDVNPWLSYGSETINRQMELERNDIFSLNFDSNPITSNIKDFLLGDITIPLFLPGGTKDISVREFKNLIGENYGLGGKVFSELPIPETRLGGLTTIGFVGGVSALPTIGRIGVGGGISFLEGRNVLNPALPPETRIASGIVGGLALAGTTFEALPFVKGGIARATGGKTPSLQSEGFEALEFDNLRIGLIPKGSPARSGETSNVDLPSLSQLKRGGFGYRSSEKNVFTGLNQRVSTSQIGFFEAGKEISLQREFFVTPEEPFINIPATRISRLGLTSLWEFPKSAEVGFGIPKQAQIGIAFADVGFKETATQFRIGTTSELEAIKGYGKITDIKRLGKGVIKGQRVDIYEFSIGKGGKGTSFEEISRLSTEGVSRVSGEVTLSSSLSITSKFPKTTKFSFPKTTFSFPTTQTTKTTQVSFPTLPKTTPTIPKTITTSPKVPITAISLPKTKTIIPTIKTTPIYPPSRPPSIPKIPKNPIKFNTFLPKQSYSGGTYRVLTKRFGKWFTIGSGLSLQQAQNLGIFKTSRTLGRSFKIESSAGKGVNIGTPYGYRRSRKKGQQNVFVELSKYALSKPTEIKEIQFFRRRKRK